MNKLLLNGIVMALIMIVIASCQYKFIVEPVPTPPDPEDTISFAEQIVPIWSDQGCTACHNGGQNPDLTPGNAYNSIMGTGMVDLENPSLSKIYAYPAPDGNHYVKYTAPQSLLILTWIEQGALDN